jgi:hypothetical protein
MSVDQVLARQVACQLMAKDALTAHARDELGISEITTARPNVGFGAGAVDCASATPQVRLAANAATARERQSRDMAELLDKLTFPLA